MSNTDAEWVNDVQEEDGLQEDEIQISLTKVEAGAVLNFFWGEWIPLPGRKEIQAVLRKLEEGLRSAQ